MNVFSLNFLPTNINTCTHKCVLHNIMYVRAEAHTAAYVSTQKVRRLSTYIVHTCIRFAAAFSVCSMLFTRSSIKSFLPAGHTQSVRPTSWY